MKQWITRFSRFASDTCEVNNFGMAAQFAARREDNFQRHHQCADLCRNGEQVSRCGGHRVVHRDALDGQKKSASEETL
jgi:hypothetical protein